MDSLNRFGQTEVVCLLSSRFFENPSRSILFLPISGMGVEKSTIKESVLPKLESSALGKCPTEMPISTPGGPPESCGVLAKPLYLLRPQFPFLKNAGENAFPSHRAVEWDK